MGADLCKAVPTKPRAILPAQRPARNTQQPRPPKTRVAVATPAAGSADPAAADPDPLTSLFAASPRTAGGSPPSSPTAAAVSKPPPLPSPEQVIQNSILHDWVTLCRLGEGGCGVVNLVHHRSRRDLCGAMKISKLALADDQATSDPTKRKKHCTDPENEWREMQSLRHPHIVGCWRAWTSASHSLHILLEYVPGCDLAAFLLMGRPGQPRPLHEALVGQIFVQQLWALWYLGTKGIVHRDLKPGNILVHFESTDEASEVNFRGPVVTKMTDFGFARTLPPVDPEAVVDAVAPLSTCGTVTYMAPERLIPVRRQPTKVYLYDCTSDIWSLGLILAELLLGRHLFKGVDATAEEVRCAQRSIRAHLVQQLPPDYADLTDLLLGMLAYAPAQRWTPAAIAAHPWVAGHMAANGIALTLPEVDAETMTNELTEEG